MVSRPRVWPCLLEEYMVPRAHGRAMPLHGASLYGALARPSSSGISKHEHAVVSCGQCCLGGLLGRAFPPTSPMEWHAIASTVPPQAPRLGSLTTP